MSTPAVVMRWLHGAGALDTPRVTHDRGDPDDDDPRPTHTAWTNGVAWDNQDSDFGQNFALWSNTSPPGSVGEDIRELPRALGKGFDAAMIRSIEHLEDQAGKRTGVTANVKCLQPKGGEKGHSGANDVGTQGMEIQRDGPGGSAVIRGTLFDCGTTWHHSSRCQGVDDAWHGVLHPHS